VPSAASKARTKPWLPQTRPPTSSVPPSGDTTGESSTYASMTDHRIEPSGLPTATSGSEPKMREF